MILFPFREGSFFSEFELLLPFSNPNKPLAYEFCTLSQTKQLKNHTLQPHITYILGAEKRTAGQNGVHHR